MDGPWVLENDATVVEQARLNLDFEQYHQSSDRNERPGWPRKNCKGCMMDLSRRVAYLQLIWRWPLEGRMQPWAGAAGTPRPLAQT